MLLKELFLNEDGGDIAIFAFGRFNPPTIAHKELIDLVKRLATNTNGRPLIFLSHTQSNKTDPLSLQEKLTYLDIELDSDTHRVFRNGVEVKLGPTEYRLLSFFMERPGRVRTREQLLDHVWGRDIYVESRTVDVHIGRLRKALIKNGGLDPIRTVRSAGYSLG